MRTLWKDVYIDSNGKIYYEISLGKDFMTGKRLKKKSSKNSQGQPFKTIDEANITVTELRLAYLKNNKQANSDILYPIFIDTVFIPEYKTTVLESTFNTKKAMYATFKEHFRTKSLRDITVQDVRQFRAHILSQGNSINYASSYFETFRKTLRQAKKWSYTYENVADDVEPIEKVASRVEHWDKEDFEQVLSTIDTSTFDGCRTFMIFWVYFNTGIRVNEGTALYWDDVNFSKKTLNITHTLIGTNKETYRRQDFTKSPAGMREISLDADTLEILKVWKEKQALGTGINSKYIFSPDGFPVAKATIQSRINKYAKLAKVKRIEIKGFRHSNISYLLNDLKVDMTIISKRAGHSSPEITYKYYAHLKKGADKELALKMAGKIKH